MLVATISILALPSFCIMVVLVELLEVLLLLLTERLSGAIFFMTRFGLVIAGFAGGGGFVALDLPVAFVRIGLEGLFSTLTTLVIAAAAVDFASEANFGGIMAFKEAGMERFDF